MILLSELYEEDSPAAQHAKQMGLISKGWGRWADSTGKVTHYTKDGQLRKVGSGELDQPAMTRRPKRTPPSRGRGAPNKIPQSAREQPQQVPVKQRPTKEDPSFDELRSAAKKHTYTVMSQERLDQIRSVPDSQQPSSEWKPQGFWFGVEDSWINWTESEAPDWKGDNLYSVEVDESKCLVIEDEQQFLDFSKKYGTMGNIGKVINWQKVADDYPGIVIKDYFWEYRLDNNHAWYYTWDVASGCVWDNSAIKSVEQVPIQ
jgi:hypothetical protein